MDWLTNVDYGHWWMLAGLLLVLELVWPMFFFLWLGIAAATVGFLVIVFPSIPFAVQFIAFGLLMVVAAVAWYRTREMHLTKPDTPAHAAEQVSSKRK